MANSRIFTVPTITLEVCLTNKTKYFPYNGNFEFEIDDVILSLS